MVTCFPRANKGVQGPASMRLKKAALSAGMRLLCCLAITGCYMRASSQIVIAFEPAVNGMTLQGLQRARIVNALNTVTNGKLRITVRDAAGSMVVSIMTPSFSLHPGVNQLNSVIFSHGKIMMGSSPAARVVSQTGRFPEGELQYCYEFLSDPPKPTSPPLVYENCYNYYIQPYSPLVLIYPANGSHLCNPRPDFSWQPPFPGSRDMRYRLILTEVQPGRPVAQIIADGLPLVDKGGLMSNLFVYQPPSPSLVRGHTYAWQVTAHVNQIMVQRSDIWVFTYDCQEEKPDSVFDSYTEAKAEIDGNYYVADKVLKFSVQNPYKAGHLDYSIVDLANPFDVIKRLPRLPLQTGLNKIDLPLSRNKAFQPGHTYLMKIHNVSNHDVVLRFTYKE